ncbi:MAG: hypothetical protein HYZ81_25645 [Nitrospinae bacterium]|nr:hypothetical protein [Nitrospinota bacterium]
MRRVTGDHRASPELPADMLRRDWVRIVLWLVAATMGYNMAARAGR